MKLISDPSFPHFFDAPETKQNAFVLADACNWEEIIMFVEALNEYFADGGAEISYISNKGAIISIEEVRELYDIAPQTGVILKGFLDFDGYFDNNISIAIITNTPAISTSLEPDTNDNYPDGSDDMILDLLIHAEIAYHERIAVSRFIEKFEQYSDQEDIT